MRAVELVKSQGLQCEFSCEDATRTPLNRLKTFYQAAEDAGADVMNIPDTLGVMEPEAMINLVTDIREAVKIPISIHCHNDFGLAAVNSLAGVKAGAEQVHVTVNGLGERAGNASLEQVVAALEMLYKVSTGINLSLLTRTSRIVQKYSLVNLPPNYPIVGENAFTQETGIHVHGLIARKETYEPFLPGLVGQKRRITIGKSTGHHAIELFLQKSSIEFNQEQMREIVNRVREIVAVKKKISDKEVLLIAKDVIRGLEKEEHVKLVDLLVKTGTISPTAKVALKLQDKTVEAESGGVGPVDSSAKAIMSALGEQFHLAKYELKAISGGADSLCQVMTVMEDMKGNTSIGSAIGPDIVKTSLEAMIESINLLYGMH